MTTNELKKLKKAMSEDMAIQNQDPNKTRSQNPGWSLIDNEE
jgi:hypothetical protein